MIDPATALVVSPLAMVEHSLLNILQYRPAYRPVARDVDGAWALSAVQIFTQRCFGNDPSPGASRPA
jgi:hypothetical protein